MGRAKRDRTILLSGMMGSGKSSVGRALAERLGWEFIDTDERVESERGLKVEEIFRQQDEAAFRQLERSVLESLPSRNAVVALGGGAVIAAEIRSLLRTKGTLVWLEAKPETLAARIGNTDSRPLLAGAEGAGRIERLRTLQSERAEAYASAEVRVSTDEKNVEEVCSAVLVALGWEKAA